MKIGNKLLSIPSIQQNRQNKETKTQQTSAIGGGGEPLFHTLVATSIVYFQQNGKNLM
jgi:hypothetical protein